MKPENYKKATIIEDESGRVCGAAIILNDPESTGHNPGPCPSSSGKDLTSGQQVLWLATGSRSLGESRGHDPSVIGRGFHAPPEKGRQGAKRSLQGWREKRIPL